MVYDLLKFMAQCYISIKIHSTSPRDTDKISKTSYQGTCCAQRATIKMLTTKMNVHNNFQLCIGASNGTVVPSQSSDIKCQTPSRINISRIYIFLWLFCWLVLEGKLITFRSQIDIAALCATPIPPCP